MFVWARSRSAKPLIDTLPQEGLVGIQIFRLVGGSFLLLWQDGYRPGLFAIPVGIGDIMVGILALALVVLMKNNRCPGWLIMAWNLFGLADHIMALFLGATTSPGPLQRYALEQPNYLGQFVSSRHLTGFYHPAELQSSRFILVEIAP